MIGHIYITRHKNGHARSKFPVLVAIQAYLYLTEEKMPAYKNTPLVHLFSYLSGGGTVLHTNIANCKMDKKLQFIVGGQDTKNYGSEFPGQHGTRK